MSIGDSAGAAEILKISPVAWHHINFRVRYKFRSGETPIDIEAIVREVAIIKVEFDFDVAGIGFGIYLLEGMCKTPHSQIEQHLTLALETGYRQTRSPSWVGR